MADQTEAEIIADLARRGQQFEKVEAGKALLVFPDKTVRSLEVFLENPVRKRAGVALNDAQSFAAYVNAHKEPGFTALFGRVNENGGSFTGIIDYHGENVADVADKNAVATRVARWGNHVASFALDFTPEWKRWTEKNGKSISQVDFAEFIEDNLGDIIKPDAADILEIAQELVAKKSVDFRSGIRLGNGETKLTYNETITANGAKKDGELGVPNNFVIRIAPFIGGAPVEISVRLRFRINEGILQFQYKMDRPHKVVEAAFKEARSFIAAETEMDVLLGSAAVHPAQ